MIPTTPAIVQVSVDAASANRRLYRRLGTGGWFIVALFLGLVIGGIAWGATAALKPSTKMYPNVAFTVSLSSAAPFNPTTDVLVQVCQR
jgi:hypothetical protein